MVKWVKGLSEVKVYNVNLLMVAEDGNAIIQKGRKIGSGRPAAGKKTVETAQTRF